MTSKLLCGAALTAAICAGVALLLASPATAQEDKTATPDDQVEAKINDLAERVGHSLQKIHAKKILVFDLTGPEGMRAQFGSWLADQVSAYFARRYPELQMIDRSAIRPLLDRRDHLAEQAGRPVECDTDYAFASKAGGSTWVSGSFSKLASGIGITLTVSDAHLSRKPATVTALLPLTEQFAALLPPSLETYVPKDGVYEAGVGGVGMPRCLNCRNPLYNDAAHRASCQGSVGLKVVVTPQGRVGDIAVVRGIPGCPHLTQAATESVSKWRFQAATGPDGQPVSVRVPVEVTFRVFQNPR
ncbi:MAG: energy transducer TonB [Candidatus Acidiferrales bacterium]|jgi:TonB family protein